LSGVFARLNAGAAMLKKIVWK